MSKAADGDFIVLIKNGYCKNIMLFQGNKFETDGRALVCT
jgi:hypothetical protein